MLCRKFYRIPNQCYDKMCKCHVSPFHFFLITEYRHTAFLNPVTGYIYTRLFSIPLHVRCNVQKSARVSHNPNVYEIRATSFFFFYYPSRVFFSLYECACREVIFKENVLFDDCFFFTYVM